MWLTNKRPACTLIPPDWPTMMSFWRKRQRFSFVCYDGHCVILGHRVRKTNYPSHFETCCHGSLSHLLPIYVVVHLRVGNVLEFDDLCIVLVTILLCHWLNMSISHLIPTVRQMVGPGDSILRNGKQTYTSVGKDSTGGEVFCFSLRMRGRDKEINLCKSWSGTAKCFFGGDQTTAV